MIGRIFISHASEDKESVARPLANELIKLGFSVWYDEHTLEIGDSLRREIDRGLSECAFGVVILSKNFFRKAWPQLELDGLLDKEIGGRKVILPVWHDVGKEYVSGYSRILSGRLAASTGDGVCAVAVKLERAIRKAGNTSVAAIGNVKNYFLTLSVSGKKVIEKISYIYQQRLGVSPEAVSRVDVKIDGYELCKKTSYIELLNSSRILIDRDDVIDAAFSVIADVTAGFVPVSWYTSNCDGSDNSASGISLSDLFVYINSCRKFERYMVGCSDEIVYEYMLAMGDYCSFEYHEDMFLGDESPGIRLAETIVSRGMWGRLGDIFDGRFGIAGSEFIDCIIYASRKNGIEIASEFVDLLRKNNLKSSRSLSSYLINDLLNSN